MREIFVVADNIVSPLGQTTRENIDALVAGAAGVRLQQRSNISDHSFFASLLAPDLFLPDDRATRFEKMIIASVTDALSGCQVDPKSPDTLFILSTTKGNISLLEDQPVDEALEKKLALHHSAARISRETGFVEEPLLVSHACISGILALVTAMRYLRWGKYKHAVVAGGDLITRFVFSGFQSFQAISPEPCRPFDAGRKGINLGEGAATLVLSTENEGSSIQLSGGAISNDANHISGPSRTGEELFFAIRKALRESGMQPEDIDFISAHGTATVYNDEMEAKAIHLAGLQEKPLNSLKGYYGHTLGAAGLIESVVSLHSLQQGLLFPTLGYEKEGTTVPVRVMAQATAGDFNTCLKTASGFGGCNAALVIKKTKSA